MEDKIKNIELILRACEKATGINPRKKTRLREYVYVRVIYYHYARKLSTRSLMDIGQEVYNRHCTVLHGLRKFDEYVLNNDFIKLHNKCVIEINSTKAFKPQDVLPELGISTDVLMNSETTKKEFIQCITEMLYTPEIVEGIVSMDTKQLEELRDCKILPHLKMLKTRKNYKKYD
tara:strand:+ start:170 stop:694 length:525 start_codon:yes stop_codon:yes gene_type:complete